MFRTEYKREMDALEPSREALARLEGLTQDQRDDSGQLAAFEEQASLAQRRLEEERAEKARLVSMALFLLVFGSVALLGLAMDNGFVLPALPAWLAAALPGLLAIVSVGGFALSYCISQAVYAKKEF